MFQIRDSHDTVISIATTIEAAVADALSLPPANRPYSIEHIVLVIEPAA